MFTALAADVVLLGLFVLFLWPHRERRSQRLLLAIFGALVGSLVGRVLVNPATMGHFAFVAGGAVLFAALDWLRHSNRSTTSGA